MKGAAGEDLAVYEGRQYSTNTSGRNVYWYPTHYVVGGGNNLFKPDGTLKDHLGSVRTTASIILSNNAYRDKKIPS